MRRAQATLEYVYMIGIAAVTLIAAVVYINRGFQGNLRGLADQMGEQYSYGQMKINYTETKTTVTDDTMSSSTTRPNASAQSSSTSRSTSDATTTTDKTGYEKTRIFANERWP